VDDIEIGLDKGKPVLEYDETNMRDSPKTEKFKYGAENKTDTLADAGDRSPGSDSKIKQRSSIDKKPKMMAKKQTGMHDADSMKLGSVDEEPVENSSVNSSKVSNLKKELQGM